MLRTDKQCAGRLDTCTSRCKYVLTSAVNVTNALTFSYKAVDEAKNYLQAGSGS